MDEVNDAIDRVLAGPEKKDRVMSEAQNGGLSPVTLWWDIDAGL